MKRSKENNDIDNSIRVRISVVLFSLSAIFVSAIFVAEIKGYFHRQEDFYGMLISTLAIILTAIELLKYEKINNRISYISASDTRRLFFWIVVSAFDLILFSSGMIIIGCGDCIAAASVIFFSFSAVWFAIRFTSEKCCLKMLCLSRPLRATYASFTLGSEDGGEDYTSDDDNISEMAYSIETPGLPSTASESPSLLHMRRDSPNDASFTIESEESGEDGNISKNSTETPVLTSTASESVGIPNIENTDK